MGGGILGASRGGGGVLWLLVYRCHYWVMLIMLISAPEIDGWGDKR